MLVAFGNERTPDGVDGVNEAFRVHREGKASPRGVGGAIAPLRSREILISNLLKQSVAGKRVGCEYSRSRESSLRKEESSSALVRKRARFIRKRIHG